MGKILNIDEFKPAGVTKEFGTINPQEVLAEVSSMKNELQVLLINNKKARERIEKKNELKLKEFEKKLDLSPLISRIERCESNITQVVSSIKNG